MEVFCLTENPMDNVRAFDPELVAEYLAASEDLFRDGALPKKVKVLMAMALDAMQASPGGVRSLTMKALEAGATWPEIRETLRVACFIGRAGPMWAAIHGLGDVVPKKK